MKLTAKFDNRTIRIFDADKLYGSIDFSAERDFQADLFAYADRFHVGPASASDKNLVVTKGSKALFAFAFDKLWGGAEIVANGENTGFEVKGRWFKAGARLVDANDNDLVSIVSHESEHTIEITVNANLEPVMVLSTLYYHLYASKSKMLSVILGASL